MGTENQSFVTEFVLAGLSQDPRIQLILFMLFSFIYFTTMMGNLLIITVTQVDLRLQTPMYFFLRSLSFIDIIYTSAIVPKMLVLFLSSKKTISYSGCMTQVYTYLLLGETECLLLAAMAYDRYVAICKPLHYVSIMNKRACFKMAAVVWMSGFVISSVDIFITLQLPFCGPNHIDHFFCEIPVLLKLACVDISMNEAVMVSGATLLLIIPLILIFVSYFRIISTVVGMHSAEGRYKAFSTCASHLIVVSLFYGTAMVLYMRPRSGHSARDKIFSVFYTIITPLLNPIIYTLRNKEINSALKRTLGKDSSDMRTAPWKRSCGKCAFSSTTILRLSKTSITIF